MTISLACPPSSTAGLGLAEVLGATDAQQQLASEVRRLYTQPGRSNTHRSRLRPTEWRSSRC